MAAETGETQGLISAISPTWLLLWTGATIPLITYLLKSNHGVHLQLRWLWYLGPAFLLSLLWAYVATRYVPEPYLDEVFHIPQAQTYGEGRFKDWDPKLTTPPGLYIYSLAIFLLGHVKAEPLPRITVLDLRCTNAIALLILGYLALLCRHELELLLAKNRTTPPSRSFSQYAKHTALNICLFPLIFFFSGLYYTDVVSTLSVLAAFLNHLKRVSCSTSGKEPSLVSGVWTLMLGNLTLAMRQTNVFWAVVFMGGLEAVQVVKSMKPPSVKEAVKGASPLDCLRDFFWRSSVGEVHDEKLSDAWIEDWICTAASLLIAGIRNPTRVLVRIWPHIGTLVSFVAFVAWNGSVVLGDKTNHVATIHLAQMLYIWPFFAFFSLPLLLPYAVRLLDHIWVTLSPSEREASAGRADTASRTVKPPASTWLYALNALYVLGTVLFSIAIVRYNTIIHPFTLADNRHYMFYIFRYTIRRANWVRYGLVVGYTLSRWLIWGLLSGSSDISEDATSKGSTRTITADVGEGAVCGSETTVTTSTAIMFLLATTLSLVTAPLVEPRYFIIPWVIWRLLIPAWHVSFAGTSMDGRLAQASAGDADIVGKTIRFAQRYDVRVILETVWFLLINGATIAIFLLKPYQWRAEDGTLLDEGRLQRFMW